jgi:hypothetical protein
MKESESDFKNRGIGVGFGRLKIEESESELLCTDSTALVGTSKMKKYL